MGRAILGAVPFFIAAQRRRNGALAQANATPLRLRQIERTCMNRSVYFDQSLALFADLVCQQWGAAALENNFFLRDVVGKLTLIALDPAYSQEQRLSLAQQATQYLGHYVDGDGFAVATPAELFDDRLLSAAHALTVTVKGEIFSGPLRLLDRRMIGADWLRQPAAAITEPQRFVFASIKGGVGRTTALCVLAAELAAKGQRVLTLDMDLEAPGLGNMLLSEDTLPEFGLLDYLVEQGLGELDDQFYADMISSSWLGGGRGKVDVLPAIGRRSLQNPANVLAKIARAYLAYGQPDEDAGENEQASFADHIHTLLARVADPLRYDVILIDARAGLHETSAAAIIGMGAEVLLFGIDQAQTFAGYDLLLAHLATLPTTLDNEWRERLHFIHAKAPANEPMREKFSDHMRQLVGAHLWPQQPMAEDKQKLADLQDSIEVEWDDEANTDLTAVLDDPVKEIDIVAILNSEHYTAFDPLANRDVLLEQLYRASFGDFLTLIDTLQTIPEQVDAI